MSNTNGSRAHNLAAWRAARREELTLPSGLVVTVQRVSILDLLEQGALPKPLLSEIKTAREKTKTSENGDDGKAEFDLTQLEKFPEYSELINLVVRAAVVEPPIADEPDDEHVGIREIPF